MGGHFDLLLKVADIPAGLADNRVALFFDTAVVGAIIAVLVLSSKSMAVCLATAGTVMPDIIPDFAFAFHLKDQKHRDPVYLFHPFFKLSGWGLVFAHLASFLNRH